MNNNDLTELRAYYEANKQEKETMDKVIRITAILTAVIIIIIGGLI